MGVHNLWELLSPIGRRVSVETLAGKRVAIDASIWIIQFMKAMRDEKGEMVRNAHLIGFFRRICKLLFLRTKPVFVFDGGTPALKRRTVIARRRQRDNAQMKIRKTAEKLLMNQLKSMKLKQLADDLKNQRKESDVKGKKILSDQTEAEQSTLERNDTTSVSYNQEKMDEMLAASLAAEENESFTGNASTSTAGIAMEEEDDDDNSADEEMILPAMPGKVDPAVLASLPPSMQLDLLVQMRERLMAENRQKYQKVKKVPAKFSELQIQSYLKTVAFRREIGEVQRSAAGRGVGGVQTSRIASESSREFIFSSSFSGDKQALTPAGVENRGNVQHPIRSDSLDKTTPTVQTSTATTSASNEPGRGLENDVETYVDDRGNVRVSRVRAMGIRMTRDLQRNLEMMKEMEKERDNASEIVNSDVSVSDVAGAPLSFPSKDKFPKTSDGSNDDRGSIVSNTNQQFVPKYEASIEISFEDNGEQKCSEGDDDIFASLVAGDPVIIPPVLNTSPMEQTFGSDSESDWEDGIVEDKASLTNDVKGEIKTSFVEGNISDESKVELDEGIWDVTESVDPPVEYSGAISKGCQEEETDMQEAIRRSIEELKQKHHVDGSSKKVIRKYHAEMAHENPRAKVRVGSSLQNSELLCGSQTGVDKQDGVIETSIPTVISNSGSQLASSTTSNSKKTHFVDLEEETLETNVSSKKIIDALNEGGETSTIDNNFQVNDSSLSGLSLNNDPDAILFDASKGGSEFGHKTTESVVPCGDFSAKRTPLTVDAEQNMADVRDKNNFLMDTEHSQAEVTESTLEEEMLVLDQEFVNLEDEQRRNERNAESVSSEMFSECQELLQMFGLPYIIAPMEAEAQCAYMELANLVDGVVTDDSDVFLFGARSVYKNIFDDRKYVETYFMKDIESELGLSRDKLIRMALLLGSDYTEGISGIGIVNAIEVVNAFPEEDGFHKFREWIESPDPNIFGKLQGQPGSISKKRGPSVDENNVNHSDGNLEGESASEPNQVNADDQSMDVMNEQRQIFMDKHRNVSKNWHIPSSFPSEAVTSAYSSPQVDKSTESFTWGKPDLNLLRKLCWGKFGWSSQKADELLLPVLKEYNKHETQLRLEAFYTFNEKFAKVRSKRIKRAVKGIIGNQSSEVLEASLQSNSKTRKKRRVDPVESAANRTEELLYETDDGVGRKESTSTSSLKQSREPVTTPLGVEKIQASTRAVGKGRVKDGSSAKSRTRGRGRKQQVGRGGRKRGQVLNSAKSSSSDGNCSNTEQETHDVKFQEPHELRRSSRSRNPVDYSANDLEFDDVENMGGEEYANKQAFNRELSSPYNLSEDEPRTVFADSLPRASVCENYYEIGNEGCTNEDELGKLNESQIGDEADYSNDYLKMGGGFCMDEDATDKSPEEKANYSASAVTAEITLGYHCSDPADKTEYEDLTELVCRSEQTLNGLQVGRSTETSSAAQNLNLVYDTTNDASDVAVPSLENTKDHNNKTSIGALSAMPLLRRKRRKI